MAMDGLERQPGVWGSALGLLGVIAGSIDAIEITLRLAVMATTGLAALAGFLYNLEKWRKERDERLKREKENVR